MKSTVRLVAGAGILAASLLPVSARAQPMASQYVALARGADGLGLISFFNPINRDLKVAHCRDLDCAQADVSVLDAAGDTGQHTSIAIGPDGRGLIAYYDATNGDLKAAHCLDVPCTSATLATLHSAGDVGTFTSLAFGADGRGLIAYLDAGNQHLMVAHCADAPCTAAAITTVAQAGVTMLAPMLAVGGDGLGLIAYVRDGQPWVAHCSAASCSSATVSQVAVLNSVQHAMVLIGPDGLGLVGFLDWRPFYEDHTRLFPCRNAACTERSQESLLPSAWDGSPALGSDGRPLFSFFDEYGGQDLVVWRCGSATCGFEGSYYSVIDSEGKVGRGSSLVIGPDGAGLIAYPGGTATWLKVAHCLDLLCKAARTSIVNGPPVPTLYHTVAPCRVVDTRSTHAPAVAAGELRYFPVGSLCGVPLDARAVAVNVTAAVPDARGNLRVFPAGIAPPLASTLNVDVGKNRANLAMVPLGAGGYLTVLYDVPPGPTVRTHLILDVFGYFK